MKNKNISKLCLLLTFFLKFQSVNYLISGIFLVFI